jgi:hypothetical protein
MTVLHRLGMVRDPDCQTDLFQARGAMLPARAGFIKRFPEWVTAAGRRPATGTKDATNAALPKTTWFIGLW